MRFRGSIKRMDKEPESILDLSSMMDDILHPRLLMSPHSHPHHKPLGQFEQILICVVITDGNGMYPYGLIGNCRISG